MSQDSFNETRAELFEALGHPLRISILEALESKPLGFADVKKSVGLESSGHLQFHLRKLGGLVEGVENGAYALTDDGRDALRMFRFSGVKTSTRAVNSLHGHYRYLMAIAILGVLLGGALLVSVESNIAQTSSLNNQLNSQRDQISSQRDQISSLQAQANSLDSQLSQYNHAILKGSFSEAYECSGSGSCAWFLNSVYANLGGRTAYSANVTIDFYPSSGGL